MNRRPERLGNLLPGVLADLAARHDATNGEPAMTTRPLVVVDTESNGLDPDKHQAVEVSYWNLTTDERGTFIPPHDPQTVLAVAEVEALRVNRYIDRIPGKPQDEDWIAAKRLWSQLDGATLAGSNPSFDARMLTKLYASLRKLAVLASQPMADRPAPWHHRLFDLSAYAAGVLGLDELPGLAKVCELLDVEPGDHTAEADVTATGLCIQKLQAITAARGTGAAA